MYRKTALLIVVVLSMLTACASQTSTATTYTKPSVIGSWQLLSEEIRIGGHAYPTFDTKTRKMMKIFNDTHFVFVSIGNERPRFSSYLLTDAEKIVAFDNFGGGGGRYTYENGFLTEHVEYMNYPNYEGESIKFKVTIDGDTLIQEGDYPIKKFGLGDQDGYLYSVFKRIPSP